MLFNSFEFTIFLPLVFTLYWFFFHKELVIQNIFLILASYFFYGFWDWRFLGLIFFSSLVDFTIGKKMGETKDSQYRKHLLWISITVNLGLLAVFKYFNFFSDSLVNLFGSFNVRLDYVTLNFILPVGISFYTFQTLSYTIDVYKKRIKPTRDITAFLAFVSFFPQLVAGPIERASNLLPQFLKERKFETEKAKDGLRQILWGFFKKVVIADSCAIGVDEIFNNHGDYSGGMLLLGAILFSFQIYGDFSGYSDIAIGLARLFGFNLMQNFAFPYFSRDIAEFWRRWHISLTTWFRDYLYIPLGGSRGGLKLKIRNTFAIFLVSGFWHGANWTFIFWGGLNALFFLPLLLAQKNRSNLDVVANNNLFPSLREFVSILSTFFVVTLAWIFFRAETVFHAFNYIEKLVRGLIDIESFLVAWNYIQNTLQISTIIFICLLLVVEWLQRKKQHGLELSTLKSTPLKWAIYTTLVFSIILFGINDTPEFIYFQF